MDVLCLSACAQREGASKSNWHFAHKYFDRNRPELHILIRRKTLVNAEQVEKTEACAHAFSRSCTREPRGCFFERTVSHYLLAHDAWTQQEEVRHLSLTLQGMEAVADRSVALLGTLPPMAPSLVAEAEAMMEQLSSLRRAAAETRQRQDNKPAKTPQQTKAAAGGKAAPPAFIQKLSNMLQQEPSAVIAWGRGGTTIQVKVPPHPLRSPSVVHPLLAASCLRVLRTRALSSRPSLKLLFAAWLLQDRERFAKEVLPKHYKTSNLSRCAPQYSARRAAASQAEVAAVAATAPPGPFCKLRRARIRFVTYSLNA